VMSRDFPVSVILSALPDEGDFIIPPTLPIAAVGLANVPVPCDPDITLLGDNAIFFR